jgi:hypothetical protein
LSGIKYVECQCSVEDVHVWLAREDEDVEDSSVDVVDVVEDHH